MEQDPNQIQEAPEEKKKAFTVDAFFDVLYLVVFAVLVVYAVYIGYNWQHYGEEGLIRISYYFTPAFVFSLVGIMTLRSDHSLVYALVSIVVTFMLMMFFHEAIYPLF